ncbi:putative polymerase ii polypeptide d [Phaeomoniella chlamydospora]|uniref:Putative polymerase ii polypeptide d n=1 Tax=Phaeomoniella chlamydospora TaxID=158046 RepID=A0A0G2GAC0_PHACM|nr:putative polymerase ii polypeptide d [Phaeomoniella chlamydospora]
MPSRRHEPGAGSDLEASSVLKLGDFQQTPTLTLSEARLILNAVVEKRRELAPNGRIQETETLTKTQDYLDMFARFKDKENVEAAERILTSYAGQLDFFERSQLGSLLPDEAEEAKALIPSLQSKISDGDLQQLLDELQKLRLNG